MTTTRHARLRNDKAAIAILEADRDYRPEPEAPPMLLTPWARRAA